MITKIANVYIRLIFQSKLKDCTSGFRCFRRAVLEALPLKQMISQGPSIVEEVLYHCFKKGFSVKEIPIIFEDRSQGKSKLNFRKFLNTFLMILRFHFLPLPK